jgi:hypothetical protein
MVLAAAACWIALPSASLASVRFGADLTQPAAGVGLGCSAGSTCTNATVVPPSAAAQLTSPVAGTVVRFVLETHSGSTAPTVSFQVIGSPDGGATFASTGTTSPAPTPTATAVTAFPARLPIQVGNYIGVEFGSVGSTGLYAIASNSAARIATFKPALLDGGTPESPTQALLAGYTLQLAADVALPPTSNAQIPPCSPGGAITATVTADPDPAVAPAAVHFRIDGGAEQTVATADSPGTATIAVPNGSHALEYWGADTVGGVESTHHTETVLVDSTPPVLSIASEQGRTSYGVGALASITVAASDSGSGLQTDPSGAGELLATSVPGTYTLTRTAIDRCGNDTTASFTYTVTAKPPDTKISRATIDQANNSATFKFNALGGTAAKAKSGFQCALLKKKGGKPSFRACASPKRYKHLSPHVYTFEVRASDAAGKDTTPAKRKFRIEA